MLSNEIKKKVEHVFGHRLLQAQDYDALSMDILNKINIRLSVNTLKRMFGYLEGNRLQRMSTLHILAQYLGYSDWYQLQTELHDSSLRKQEEK